jgi:hypothetical protein
VNKKELKILKALDSIVKQESVRAAIDLILPRVEEKLMQDPGASLAWEPIPLSIYSGRLLNVIRSS